MNIRKEQTNMNISHLQASFEKIYPAADIPQQISRYERLTDNFFRTFPEYNNIEPSYFSASGRSEIIGNHTDHNNGIVLAAGINLDTIAASKKTDDNTVVLVSEGFSDEVRVSLDDLKINKAEYGTTNGLVRGIAAKMSERGYKIGGFRAYTTTNVLRGSGLSSSAAIEILVYTIFNHFYNDGKLSLTEGAIISQESENLYFGKPCGLMDQLACALGRLSYIDFKDKKAPQTEVLNFDFAKYGYSIIITDVHADHADLTDEYAAITREMKSVADFFGKNVLRELDETEFYAKLAELRKKVSDRAVMRAMHFFEENKRVVSAVNAIKTKNIDEFLRAISASGRSSEDLLQNTHPTGSTAQAMTLALALANKFLAGEGACRVHGGGFGGTILAFVPNDKKDEYIKNMSAVFGDDSCTILSIRPTGAMMIE